MRRPSVFSLFLLLVCAPLLAQIIPIPNLTVMPRPIPGGDVVPGYGLINQFLPGPPNQTPPFDPANADPGGIANYRGFTAMGYTSGPATDNNGTQYVVVTDVRVYQGEYIGAEIADPNSAGATMSARDQGTFVEI